MLFRSKNGKIMSINEKQFKNDSDIYKFIRSEKFDQNNKNNINNIDNIIALIKKRPCK